MEGPGKDWSPEWGKGPARLPGVRQEGRERGEGQPCRRGRAGTLILTLDPPSPPPRGPAPRPDPPGTPTPRPSRPRASGPPPPQPRQSRPLGSSASGPGPSPTPKEAQEVLGRRRDFPGPPPSPAPTCRGGVGARNFPGQREEDAPGIQGVELAHPHFSTLRQGSLATPRPCPVRAARAAPVSTALPRPRPPAKFGPELTGPRAGRALKQRAGSRGRGAGVARGAGRPRGRGRRAVRARSACGAARARGARSAGPPSRPRRRPDNAPLGRTHGARRRRHRPGHAHQVSAPGPRPPKHRGALKGDAARPRPGGRGLTVGGGA